LVLGQLVLDHLGVPQRKLAYDIAAPHSQQRREQKQLSRIEDDAQLLECVPEGGPPALREVQERSQVETHVGGKQPENEDILQAIDFEDLLDLVDHM
jgi:hypothetical protein